MLEGDKEGWTESPGNADGELECPAKGSDSGTIGMLVSIKNPKKKRRNKIIVSADEASHEKLMEDEIQILLKATYRSNQSQGSPSHPSNDQFDCSGHSCVI